MTIATDQSKTKADVKTEQWMRMYRRMVMIREFEEQVNELYTRALMPGLAHLYIGEEAVAVGICEALRGDDYITSTHRGHGHCVAKGASPDRMFAELLGKEAGYCRGKGGSMHIAELRRERHSLPRDCGRDKWRCAFLAKERWGREFSMK
jgi:acetoin:2,6-dichlorophenolindophenol oxidoreductase subunit alpha